jgi:hypothetical protein
MKTHWLTIATAIALCWCTVGIADQQHQHGNGPSGGNPNVRRHVDVGPKINVNGNMGRHVDVGRRTDFSRTYTTPNGNMGRHVDVGRRTDFNRTITTQHGNVGIQNQSWRVNGHPNRNIEKNWTTTGTRQWKGERNWSGERSWTHNGRTWNRTNNLRVEGSSWGGDWRHHRHNSFNFVLYPSFYDSDDFFYDNDDCYYYWYPYYSYYYAPYCYRYYYPNVGFYITID